MRKYEELRVVAFGGGTGLPVLLGGLRDRVGNLTAVVTVADDGGSSGRLRQELGVAPPGDVRNCLVALAGRKNLAEVFNYRFEGGGDLSDHSVGNIIIAALADMAGGFCEGVEQAARFLRIKGRVYPANVMTQPGETAGFSVSDHLRALADHAGPVVTDVLVHAGGMPEELVARYAAEGAALVEVDREEIAAVGVRLHEAGLLPYEIGASVRHDPDRLAREVCEAVLVRF